MLLNNESFSIAASVKFLNDNLKFIKGHVYEVNIFVQRTNVSVPLHLLPAESRCSFGVLQYQQEIFQGRHMLDYSSSHHDPEHRELLRGTFGIGPSVAFPQGEPLCTAKFRKAIRHEKNSLRLWNEGELAMPLDLNVPDERSRGKFHKPQHATSLTRKSPLSLHSQSEQLLEQSDFPQRRNDSKGRSLLDSSYHHEERIHKDLIVQREAVLVGGDEFVCSVCNLRLPNHANLQQHEEMHTRERLSAYNIYYKNLTVNNELLQLNESRTRERSLSCTECDKKCSTMYNLRQHQQTHVSESPYRCDFCSYTSDRKGDFKKHQRKHTGERPFKCEICGYAFACSSTLTTHRRTHTGERPYRCKSCDYAAARSFSLKEHIRVRHETHERSNSETSGDSPTS